MSVAITAATTATSTAAGAKAVGAAQAARHAELTDLARKWVATTFFGTMLRQMRDSAFKSELFSGGRGGEAFQEMYDQHLAERMARGAGRSLADSVVRHIERRSSRAAGAAEAAARVPASPEAGRSADVQAAR